MKLLFYCDITSVQSGMNTYLVLSTCASRQIYFLMKNKASVLFFSSI